MRIPISSPSGYARSEPGKPGSLFCDRQAPLVSLGDSSAVTKFRFSTYNRVSAFSDGNPMSSLAATDERQAAAPTKVIQPAWVRTMHWNNAVAVILMIMSGLQIYNASPLFGFLRFSHAITLGGWLGGALLWHFAA